MRSKIFFKRLFITIFVIAIVSGGIYLWKLYKTPIPYVQRIFKVEKVDNAYKIALRLKQEGLIRSAFPFYFSHLFLGRGTTVEPGAYKLSTDMNVKQMIFALEEKPYAKYVELPEGLNKEEMGDILAEALGWKVQDKQFFPHTMSGMQWQDYEDVLQDIFTDKYEWKKTKTQTFLTLSSLYVDPQYDFFKHMYMPGVYEIPLESSRAEVAGLIIDKFDTDNKDKDVALKKYLDTETMDNVAKLLETEMILMPDIVAIPPQDVTLKKEGGKLLLLFTTSYWNKGRGPLELVADPKTKGVVGDQDRDVYQRIYHLDGDYTERVSGKFLWHQTHLHYHFQDFAVYELLPVDIEDKNFSEVKSFKSTFCVRDSEPIDLSSPGANKEASYKICGKERQGISPGWADSYYFSYIDQRFDITNIPKGTYRLRVIINPKDRFDEITKENNVGEVLLSIDPSKSEVKVISEKQYGL